MLIEEGGVANIRTHNVLTHSRNSKETQMLHTKSQTYAQTYAVLKLWACSLVVSGVPSVPSMPGEV